VRRRIKGGEDCGGEWIPLFKKRKENIEIKGRKKAFSSQKKKCIESSAKREAQL